MSKRKTTKEFIQDAIKVHGDKYDYSEVEYKNCDTKVKIKCNTCGNTFIRCCRKIPNFSYGDIWQLFLDESHILY